MTFKDLYYDCDVLICEQFEGDPPRYNFTEEQWEYVTDAALYALTMRFTDYARQLMDTRLMQHPRYFLEQRF